VRHATGSSELDVILDQTIYKKQGTQELAD